MIKTVEKIRKQTAFAVDTAIVVAIVAAVDPLGRKVKLDPLGRKGQRERSQHQYLGHY